MENFELLKLNVQKREQAKTKTKKNNAKEQK